MAQDYISQYPPAHSSTYVKATSTYPGGFESYHATDPAKSLMGTNYLNQWNSAEPNDTNQRFHIDLGSAKIVTRIYYENGHASGLHSAQGVKNFTFWGSNSPTAFSTLTYGTDTDWTQLTCAATQFDQHAAADAPDPKYITVSNAVAYRYYAIKFADVWDPVTYASMSLRRIVLQIDDPFDKYAADAAGFGDSVDAQSLTDSITDQAGFGDSADGFSLTDQISDAAGFGDAVDGNFEFDEGITDQAGFGDAVNATTELQSTMADAAGFGDAIDALNWSEWLRNNLDQAVARYYLTITGAPDLTTDIEIPMQSFQARKQSGRPTYVSAVVPGMAYADAIAARANGEIVIEMVYVIGGVESLREEILRADLEQINLSKGTGSRSITLIGHRTETFVAKNSELLQPTYEYTSDGRVGYRFAVPDLWANPGDTIKVGTDEFTCDSIVYIVSAGAGQTVMEVQE